MKLLSCLIQVWVFGRFRLSFVCSYFRLWCAGDCLLIGRWCGCDFRCELFVSRRWCVCELRLVRFVSSGYELFVRCWWFVCEMCCGSLLVLWWCAGDSFVFPFWLFLTCGWCVCGLLVIVYWCRCCVLVVFVVNNSLVICFVMFLWFRCGVVCDSFVMLLWFA